MFHCVQNSAVQRWDFWSSSAYVQRSFYLSPGLGLTSTIHSYFPQCYLSEKASSHPLDFTGDTGNRDREKRSGQAQLFNIWTKGVTDRTSGQPQVKLRLLRSISVKKSTTGLYSTHNISLKYFHISLNPLQRANWKKPWRSVTEWSAKVSVRVHEKFTL